MKSPHVHVPFGYDIGIRAVFQQRNECDRSGDHKHRISEQLLQREYDIIQQVLPYHGSRLQLYGNIDSNSQKRSKQIEHLFPEETLPDLDIDLVIAETVTVVVFIGIGFQDQGLRGNRIIVFGGIHHSAFKTDGDPQIAQPFFSGDGDDSTAVFQLFLHIVIQGFKYHFRLGTHYPVDPIPAKRLFDQLLGGRKLLFHIVNRD